MRRQRGMRELGRVPWHKINDYLLEVESASRMEDFLVTSIEASRRLVPFDSASAIFDSSRRALAFLGISDPEVESYNEYYRHKLPGVLAPGPACMREYDGNEYVADFARPHKIWHSVVHFQPGHRVALALNRSPSGPAFTDLDYATLAMANWHLNNLFSVFERIAASASWLPSKEAVAEAFPRLSRREAEIGSLLCLGLTSAEIATRLFISVRTAETHLLHLYDKLAVRSRREAAGRLRRIAAMRTRADGDSSSAAEYTY